MKTRAFWMIIPAVLITLGACDKKETAPPQEPAAKPVATAPAGGSPADPAAPAPAPAPAPATPEVKPAAPAPVVPEVKPLTAEQRAAKHGFARYLPADTESVITVHNGNKISERAQNLKLWKVIQEQMGVAMEMGGKAMPPDMEMDEDEADEDFPVPPMEEEGDKEAPAPDATQPAEPSDDAKEPEEDKSLAGALLGTASGTTLINADAPNDGVTETKPTEGDQANTATAPADETKAEEGATDAAKPDEANADAEPMDEDEAMPEEIADPFNPADMLGQEVTVAVGKSAGEQLGNLLTAYERFYYFFMRSATKAFAASAKEGDFSGMENAMNNAMGEELAKDLITDPESGIALIERASMPPLYVAFRTTKEKQQGVADNIGQTIDMMGSEGEVSEPVTIEKAGASLTGHKFLGAKIVEELAPQREDLENTLGAENVEKLMAVIAKKNLVVASGTLGEYVVIFVASSEQDFGLTADPAQALTAGTALAFADVYADKEMAALIYGNESASKALFKTQSGLAMYANGIRDGLSGSEGLGETRDLEAMLQMVAERETALRKLGGSEALGVVAFFDEGLRIESYGGYDPGALDWKTPNRLGHLGDSPDVAVFANATAEAAFDEKALAYYESIVETAYAAAVKMSELPIEDGDMQEFKGMMEKFNQNFRSDALSLWDAVRGDLDAGLGQESALVLDLKGTMPTFPGLPQTVVDKARFPRATVIMPVTDRAKLRSSWTKINEASTKLLAKISELSGEDIPMQKPISSEKDGYTTWFMSLPFQSNDFIPSVTVGDKWFAASTSKDRALELLALADKGSANRTGLWLRVDFKAFQQYAAESLQMLDDNAKEIFGDNESMLEQLTSTKELRGKVLDALTELDSLTVHSRRDNGVLRGSIHFKTR